jgi:inosine-uridine nucleoside N-ribohydrolase
MHGSVRIGYENNPEPCVEFNMGYVPGAKKVFSAPWKSIAITPLDTCGLVRLTGSNFEKVMSSEDPLVKSLLENYRLWANKKSLDELKESSILFDTVAIYLADPGPKPLLELEQLHIDVTDKGMMVIDAKAPSMNVATKWKNLSEYHEHLVKVLLSPTVKKEK